jgi:heptosyltransferase-1
LTSVGSEIFDADALFIRLRLLGDIVFTIPAVQLFKERFPGTRLHYVVEERFRDVAELIPGVDHVIAVPRRRGIAAILAFRKQVRSLRIGTIVDFHSGPGSALLTRASGAPLRIGYRTPNRNWAYNKLVERFDPSRPAHSVHNQARLLEALGVDACSLPQYPFIDPRAFPVSPRLAPLLQLQPRVVLHLGAGNRFRDWGEDHFSALVQRLGAQKVHVVLFGGTPEEAARGAKLGGHPYVHDASGRLSAKEILSLVTGAAAYVGADSGPLHLASLTATPLVALYGPNLAEVSGPWRREGVVIVQMEMACRPCSQRSCKYGTIPCMRNISTDRVYEAVSQFIH